MAAPALEWPPHRREWTEADLEVMPDDGSTYEVLDGRLIVTPPPSEAHQATGGAVFVALLTAAPRGWRVRYEIGVRLPDGFVQPDLTVLRPDAPRGNVWTDASHVGLVVEIASHSTRHYDAGDKCAAYARAGIPHYWRVVPGPDGGVHLHVLGDHGEYDHHATVRPGEMLTVTEPFEITVDPARWFDPDG